MNSLPSRSLFLTQANGAHIETSVANVTGGSDQLVTRVNHQIVYLEGLTSVTKYTSNKAALEHHTKWASRVLNGMPAEASRPVELRQAA